MSKKKSVLLLRSNFIDLEPIKNSPRFLNYSFFLFEALPIIECNEKSQDETFFLKKLHEKIIEISADILFIHVGIAFEKYPFILTSAVVEIKNSFPNIQIGFDRKPDYIVSVLNSHSKILPNNQEFINETQIVKLIDKTPEIEYLSNFLL